MADQNMMSQIMNQLAAMQQGQPNMQGPGFGQTGPGVPLTPVASEPQAMPGMPIDYRNPAMFNPQNPNLSTSQPNGDFAATLAAIMGQGGNQGEFLNGLLSGLFNGPRPPRTGLIPSQPGNTPRMPTPGYPGGNMQGPGFGQTGPGVPVSPMPGSMPGIGQGAPAPIAGPGMGGRFQGAPTTQPQQKMSQMPAFGDAAKRPF